MGNFGLLFELLNNCFRRGRGAYIWRCKYTIKMKVGSQVFSCRGCLLQSALGQRRCHIATFTAILVLTGSFGKRLISIESRLAMADDYEIIHPLLLLHFHEQPRLWTEPSTNRKQALDRLTHEINPKG